MRFPALQAQALRAAAQQELAERAAWRESLRQLEEQVGRAASVVGVVAGVDGEWGTRKARKTV